MITLPTEVGSFSGSCRFLTAQSEPENVACSMYRASAFRAGRLLDGRTWDEYPSVVAR